MQTSTPTASFFTSKRRHAHFFLPWFRYPLGLIFSSVHSYHSCTHKVHTAGYSYRRSTTLRPRQHNGSSTTTNQTSRSIIIQMSQSSRIAKSKNINFTNWPLVHHSALGHIHMNIDTEETWLDGHGIIVLMLATLSPQEERNKATKDAQQEPGETEITARKGAFVGRRIVSVFSQSTTFFRGSVVLAFVIFSST